MDLHIDPSYIPGRVITCYAGDDEDIIASIDTLVNGRPIYAAFFVHGPWSFTITSATAAEARLTGTYTRPSQITSELEPMLLTREDCRFELDGEDYELRWEDEPLPVAVIRDGGTDDRELDFTVLPMLWTGPDAKELRNLLAGAIQDYEHTIRIGQSRHE